MKKTILAILLSAFLCNNVFAQDDTGNPADLYEFLQQELNLENNSDDAEQDAEQFEEPEYVDAEYIDSEYTEPGFTDPEYTETNYEEPLDNNFIDSLEESSIDNVLNILISCKEYTLEDGVEEKDLNQYLLICVNNILNENGYKSIKSLPVE